MIPEYEERHLDGGEWWLAMIIRWKERRFKRCIDTKASEFR